MNNKLYNIINNLLICIIIILIFIIIMLLIVKNTSITKLNTNKYDDGNIVEKQEQEETPTRSKYQTSITFDNYYDNSNVKTVKDAYKLIVDDSVNQKSSCPKEILDIENEIIEKYDISAVNLCELDINLANKIKDIIDTIYNDYPLARGYLTNLTIGNLTMDESNIVAFFQSSRLFSLTKKDARIYKMIMLLNSRYFLNTTLLSASSRNAGETGWWPRNTNEVSVVIHELGHYLSFLSSLQKHNYNLKILISKKDSPEYYEIISNFSSGKDSYDLINEAYNKFIKDTNSNATFDNFRRSISEYAIAKDKKGNYIYDETIAEAFHDVYLNKESARPASIYIVNELKQYLGG